MSIARTPPTVVVPTSTASQTALSIEPDWSAWDGLFTQHVRTGEKYGVELALVDYEDMARDSCLKQAIEVVERYPTAILTNDAERLALCIVRIKPRLPYKWRLSEP